MKNITVIHFSPSGTTKKSADTFAKSLTENYKTINLFCEDIYDTKIYNSDDLVLVALPVFGGVMPEICEEKIKKIKSNGAYVAIMAVYGNRDFDDTLIQTYDYLIQNNFKLVGAAAIVAQHSLFNSVATGRPNEQDLKVIEVFSQTCLKRAENDEEIDPVFKGNRPYKTFGGIPFVPKADENCTNCGKCVNVCPVGAIDIKTPQKTDKDKCIACTACINVCPVNSRGFHSVAFKVAEKGFALKVSKPKESIWY